MLSSNWYYLVRKFFPSSVVNPSVMWIEFFSSKTVNFPLLFSLTYLFLLFRVLAVGRWNLKQGIMIGFLSGLLFAFKSHVALVWFAALVFTQLICLFRRDFRLLKIIPFALVALFLVSHGLSSGSSTLALEPLWFIKVMYESSDHLNFPVWELRRQTLLSLGSFIGIAKLYLAGLGWFSLINFGPFLIAIPFIWRLRSPKAPLSQILLWGLALGGFFATMSFTYKPVAIVTIQFVYLTLVSLGILSALLLGELFHNHSKAALVLAVFFWASLLPGTAYIVTQYQSNLSTSISQEQISAINYLNHIPSGTILTDNSFFSGSVFSAYTHDDLYLGDIQTVRSLGIDSTQREANSRQALNCNFPPEVNYILIKKSTPNRLASCSLEIFSNSEISIFKP
jgi:hypothetical protein